MARCCFAGTRMRFTTLPCERCKRLRISNRYTIVTLTRLPVIDRERMLIRIDHLQQYVRDLRTITPPTFEAYQGIATRRACERLLQLAIEAVTDISGMLVAGLRLGLPAEDLDT